MFSLNFDIAWLIDIIAISGNFYIIKKNPFGFVLWVISNILFIVYNLYKESNAQAFLFFVYGLFAIYGWVEWKHPHLITVFKSLININGAKNKT